MNEIAIFKTNQGVVEVKLAQETVWLTQKQMATLFESSIDNISLHLKNIYADEELMENATTEDFSIVQKEGNRNVTRKLKNYNLDAIISVGYRVNSKKGVQFRQWASQLLKQHLIQGYTLNRERLTANAQALEAALELVRKTAQSAELTGDIGRGLIDVVTRYTQTFLLLQKYDEGLLAYPEEQAGGVLQTLAEARTALARLKADLMARGEATDESKAAHLLYFVIKNHLFSDGKKRSGDSQ